MLDRKRDNLLGLYFSLSVVAIPFNLGSFICDILFTTDIYNSAGYFEYNYPYNEFIAFIVIRYTLTIVIFVVDIITTAVSILCRTENIVGSIATHQDYLVYINLRQCIKNFIKCILYVIASCNIL